MVFNISDYLKKTLKAGNDRDFLKISVMEAIKETLNIELEGKEIQFREGTVLIKKNPVVRSAIAIKKILILKRIKEKVGENKVFDIK